MFTRNVRQPFTDPIAKLESDVRDEECTLGWGQVARHGGFGGVHYLSDPGADPESARRRPVDHGREELRQYPLQYAHSDQCSNVKNLKLAWTFSTGLTRGHEAAPLVVNNTMYIVTPWPNLLYALDLTKPGAPVKWTYEPNPSASRRAWPVAMS